MHMNVRTVKLLVAVWVGVSLWLPLSRPSYGQTNLQIWHTPPKCAVAGNPIRISANIPSATSPAEVRIYFRKQGTTPFYFIPMQPTGSDAYTGILPAPVKTVKFVEYCLLVVDRDDRILKSPLFSVPVRNASDCPEFLNRSQPDQIVVSAEQVMSPEIGFSGKNVHWNVSQYPGRPYMYAAREIQVQALLTDTSSVQENKSFPSPKPGLDMKKALAIGAGVGALGVAGVLIARGAKQEESTKWTISADDPAKKVGAELNKAPEIQTACGTIVTNQLYVTNKRAESIEIGTIDYEIVLNRDNPTGSCEGGRIGAFSPNVTTVVQPGETALIREWSNEVNPCSDCPYLMAKCRWNSRYVIHTSAGSAVAEATFAVEGNLCPTSSRKSVDNGIPLKGDVEP